MDENKETTNVEINEEPININAFIEDAVANLDSKYSEKDKEEQMNLLKVIFDEGLLPREAMGFTDEMIDTLYDYGYRRFTSGNYDEAEVVFRLLLALDPNDAKYPFALATSYHHQKKYKNAADSYYLASFLDPLSPLPFFHMSDCFLQMDDKFSALVALGNTIRRAEIDISYANILDRAKMAFESLEKQLADEIKQQENQEKKS